MPRLISLFTLLLGTALQAAPPDFDKQIAPLLASHCIDCHRGAKPKGDFDLTRKAAVRGKETTILERVAADEMPPKKPLSAADKKLLKEWVEAGAKWGTDPIDPFRFTSSSRAGFDWWALQPIKPVTVPKSKLPNPIDAFVQAKLSDKGLSPSPPAEKRVLIRRLTFDLIGLPPAPEEVAAFLKDESPQAYEKVVDRLLTSPRYGERMTLDWLDAARRETVAAEAKGERRAAGVSSRLNRATRDMIGNVEPIATGDRHRLLFSAAANLAEFGCPSALAHELLSEAGRDAGLSPSEVRRQIDCGLSHHSTTGGPVS